MAHQSRSRSSIKDDIPKENDYVDLDVQVPIFTDEDIDFITQDIRQSWNTSDSAEKLTVKTINKSAEENENKRISHNQFNPPIKENMEMGDNETTKLQEDQFNEDSTENKSDAESQNETNDVVQQVQPNQETQLSKDSHENQTSVAIKVSENNISNVSNIKINVNLINETKLNMNDDNNLIDDISKQINELSSLLKKETTNLRSKQTGTDEKLDQIENNDSVKMTDINLSEISNKSSNNIENNNAETSAFLQKLDPACDIIEQSDKDSNDSQLENGGEPEENAVNFESISKPLVEIPCNDSYINTSCTDSDKQEIDKTNVNVSADLEYCKTTVLETPVTIKIETVTEPSGNEDLECNQDQRNQETNINLATDLNADELPVIVKCETVTTSGNDVLENHQVQDNQETNMNIVKDLDREQAPVIIKCETLNEFSDKENLEAILREKALDVRNSAENKTDKSDSSHIWVSAVETLNSASDNVSNNTEMDTEDSSYNIIKETNIELNTSNQSDTQKDTLTQDDEADKDDCNIRNESSNPVKKELVWETQSINHEAIENQNQNKEISTKTVTVQRPINTSVDLNATTSSEDSGPAAKLSCVEPVWTTNNISNPSQRTACGISPNTRVMLHGWITRTAAIAGITDIKRMYTFLDKVIIESDRNNKSVLRMAPFPKTYSEIEVIKYIMNTTSQYIKRMFLKPLKAYVCPDTNDRKFNAAYIKFRHTDRIVATKVYMLFSRDVNIINGHGLNVLFDDRSVIDWDHNDKPFIVKDRKEMERTGPKPLSLPTEAVSRPPPPPPFKRGAMDLFDTINYGLSREFLYYYNIKKPLVSHIIVNNLDPEHSIDKYRRSFAVAGAVSEVDAIPQDDTTKLKLRVLYGHPLESVQAIAMFSQQIIFGRKVEVTMGTKQNSFTNMNLVPESLLLGPGLGPNGQALYNISTQIEVKRWEKEAKSKITDLRFELQTVKKKLMDAIALKKKLCEIQETKKEKQSENDKVDMNAVNTLTSALAKNLLGLLNVQKNQPNNNAQDTGTPVEKKKETATQNKDTSVIAKTSLPQTPPQAQNIPSVPVIRGVAPSENRPRLPINVQSVRPQNQNVNPTRNPNPFALQKPNIPPNNRPNSSQNLNPAFQNQNQNYDQNMLAQMNMHSSYQNAVGMQPVSQMYQNLNDLYSYCHTYAQHIQYGAGYTPNSYNIPGMSYSGPRPDMQTGPYVMPCNPAVENIQHMPVVSPSPVPAPIPPPPTAQNQAQANIQPTPPKFQSRFDVPPAGEQVTRVSKLPVAIQQPQVSYPTVLTQKAPEPAKPKPPAIPAVKRAFKRQLPIVAKKPKPAPINIFVPKLPVSKTLTQSSIVNETEPGAETPIPAYMLPPDKCREAKINAQIKAMRRNSPLQESLITGFLDGIKSKTDMFRESPEKASGAFDKPKLSNRSPDKSTISRTPEMRKISRSPDGRKISRSPEMRKMSRSPERRKTSRSPDRRKISISPDRRKMSRSPDRKKISRSPDRRKISRSPERRKISRSPDRRISRSPVRRISRSPIRRRISRSPNKRKFSRSPNRRRMSRSPQKRRFSRSPKRRRVSRSPDRRSVSKSPERRRLSRSPIKTRTSSPRPAYERGIDRSRDRNPKYSKDQKKFPAVKEKDLQSKFVVSFSYLPSSVTAEDLREQMGEVGKVLDVELFGKGMASVVFMFRREALTCVEMYNFAKVDGQTIRAVMHVE